LLHFWRCCGGGRWLCLGSRTAAPSGVAATFFLLPAVLTLLLLFVSVAPSVNNVLLSLQWRHGGAGAAGGWRLVAVSWLTDGGSKQRQRSYFFQCFPMILPVCFLQVFNSSFLLLCFGLSLSLSFGFFRSPPFLSSVFSFFGFSPSFSLFFVFLLPFVSSSFRISVLGFYL
jgi:hypothetical protein